LEIRADVAQFKNDIEKLDDAAAELMMSSGKVLLFMGESFIETDEDYANECRLIIAFLYIVLFSISNLLIIVRILEQTVKRNNK
jgi:hypothetical protein